jgi:hypothetical protein
MIIANLKSRDSVSILNLDSIVGMEYDHTTGEFLFLTHEGARVTYLDKGTPQAEVWEFIHQRLRPAFDPRALQTHAVLVEFDFTPFQKNEPKVF